MTNAYRVESVAEAFLVLMRRRGIDHFFVNAGTDSASLVEAYARQPQSGLEFPNPVVCTHENLAVGMAHGYTMVTGRPQAVMLHVSVGAANAVCALMNAARDNIPMLFTAGRTPLFEQGRKGARNVPIHWAQEMFDQAGMVREIVKWDYELRDGLNLEDIVTRALAVTGAPPQGPVYLTLPREILASEMRDLVLQQEELAVPTEPAPDPRAVERLASLIAAAEFPVIATATAGRRPVDVPVLAALCERHGIGVVETHARYLGLSAGHPMHLGTALRPHFGRADLILVLEADVPWMPATDGGPPAATTVVHAGVDPLFARYPVRGYRSDLTITASVSALLPALAAALDRAPGAATAGRRDRVAAAARAVREARAAQIAALKASPRMTKDWLNLCLSEAKPADAIVVNEYWANRAILDCESPGGFYHHPPAAGLGWGMPAALGVQLAQPDRPVIATLGDGAYLFANPAACHQAAAALGLPVLTILCNNARWQAVQNAAQTLYPEGHSARHATPVPLADLSPTPAFEMYAQASGGHGECVRDPAALPDAIARALRVVREERRQALLNVLCE
jgi:acetolactate synthase I/II/III large subunit